MIIHLSNHARQRHAERCPRALPPWDGIELSLAQARRIGAAATPQTSGDAARSRRISKQIRRAKEAQSRDNRRTRFFLTATACWLVDRNVAVTVVEVGLEDLAGALVWTALGVWP